MIMQRPSSELLPIHEDETAPRRRPSWFCPNPAGTQQTNGPFSSLNGTRIPSATWLRGMNPPGKFLLRKASTWSSSASFEPVDDDEDDDNIHRGDVGSKHGTGGVFGFFDGLDLEDQTQQHEPHSGAGASHVVNGGVPPFASLPTCHQRHTGSPPPGGLVDSSEFEASAFADGDDDRSPTTPARLLPLTTHKKKHSDCVLASRLTVSGGRGRFHTHRDDHKGTTMNQTVLLHLRGTSDALDDDDDALTSTKRERVRRIARRLFASALALLVVIAVFSKVKILALPRNSSALLTRSASSASSPFAPALDVEGDFVAGALIKAPRDAIREAAELLQPRAFESSLAGGAGGLGVSAEDFVRGTEALSPVFERLGLARLVAVNLDKLRALRKKGLIKGASRHSESPASSSPEDMHRLRDDRDVAALLRRDAETGDWRRDESATVAVLWNGRVLHFLAVLVDGIVDADNHVLDPTATRPASLADLARRAYSQTLYPHHSLFLRSAARALLALAPTDRSAFFVDNLGYAPDEWSTRFKSDLTDLSLALHTLLAHLRLAFQVESEGRFQL